MTVLVDTSSPRGDITLTVPEDVLRTARIRAAERSTSVSAMVREFLVSLAEPDAEFRRLEQVQESVIREIQAFDGGDRMTREELHDRAVR